ncbi:ribosome silencing factor [Helicobacter sp. 11S03491-1]|uniref:ribosome silencing factor n=1 Tax=Helicobacter sp. 11S03491-1 TaxID=1476196 RepID=UPI000BA6E337|nr:ribosome silencing factor [Helicobacter sp. 11S03491-1]PAF42322.1 ribosome silencing factor [Helicobacter sp. 11S03491-1]
MKQKTQKIISLLDEKKAEDIATFDLKGKDYIVECVIIATAMAGKHAYALLDMLKTELKPLGEVFYSTDEESEDWLIADLGDVMIHIFTQNHRKKFNLEEFLTQINEQKSLQI